MSVYRSLTPFRGRVFTRHKKVTRSTSLISFESIITMAPSRALSRKLLANSSLILSLRQRSEIISPLQQRRWLNATASGPRNPPRKTDTDKKGPLSGIRVLDMTRVLAGVSYLLVCSCDIDLGNHLRKELRQQQYISGINANDQGNSHIAHRYSATSGE